MAHVWDIDDWVEQAACLPIKSFYPTQVAKDTELPIDIVFDRLLALVRDEKLLLFWEVRCPNYECFRNVTSTEDPDELLNHESTCRICGEEFCITKDSIFPAFSVTETFKSRGKKKRVAGKSIRHQKSRLLH